ncbi:MAG: hypothetical protein H7Z38_04905 [Rubrivivax sp.]|nr:hypothetical protein [Pyrinomonadaceae bacterium]
MNNEFAQLVKKASELNWCTQIYCTTCANGEFRKDLKQLGGGNSFELAQVLADLDIDEYSWLRDWDDCLRIAFLHLPFPGQHEKILSSWIPKLNKNIRFADVVLFYIVRSLPFGIETSRAWISACVNLAVNSKDESLVESLVWVLRSELPKYDGLIHTAKHLSATSFKVKRAMIKTDNLQ